MPTGYTSKIYDGDQTTVEQYAKTCLVAFLGESYQNIADTPGKIPLLTLDEFSSYTYYKDNVDRAESELKKKLAFTEDDWIEYGNTVYNAKIKNNKDYIANAEKIGERYKSMMELVNNWVAPSNLQELKKFMISQLNSAYKFDVVDTLEYSESYIDIDKSGYFSKEYREGVIGELKDNIAYFKENMIKIKNRFDNINNMITDFNKSLYGVD